MECRFGMKTIKELSEEHFGDDERKAFIIYMDSVSFYFRQNMQKNAKLLFLAKILSNFEISILRESNDFFDSNH